MSGSRQLQKILFVKHAWQITLNIFTLFIARIGQNGDQKLYMKNNIKLEDKYLITNLYQSETNNEQKTPKDINQGIKQASK